MTPIKQIATLLTAYRPHFGNQDTDYSPAARWLEAGCDLERDILPIIKGWIAWKGDIHYVSFFTKPVMQAKQARENAERARQPIPDEQRAKRYAFLIRKLGRAMPAEARWLVEYEQRNGPVAA